MNWLLLLTALISVESGGNDKAEGDNGKAWGCLQIHNIVVKDVNRIYKKEYEHKDAFDRKKAQEICLLYLAHYSKVYETKTGKPADYEVLARIWNGGPTGYNRPTTVKYWWRVNAEIRRLHKEAQK